MLLAYTTLIDLPGQLAPFFYTCALLAAYPFAIYGAARLVEWLWDHRKPRR